MDTGLTSVFFIQDETEGLFEDQGRVARSISSFRSASSRIKQMCKFMFVPDSVTTDTVMAVIAELLQKVPRRGRGVVVFRSKAPSHPC